MIKSETCFGGSVSEKDWPDRLCLDTTEQVLVFPVGWFDWNKQTRLKKILIAGQKRFASKFFEK